MIETRPLLSTDDDEPRANQICRDKIYWAAQLETTTLVAHAFSLPLPLLVCPPIGYLQNDKTLPFAAAEAT